MKNKMNDDDDFSTHMKDLINKSRFTSFDNNKSEDKIHQFSKERDKKGRDNNGNNNYDYSTTKVCMTYDLMYIDTNGKKAELITDLCDEPDDEIHEKKSLDNLDFEISFVSNKYNNKRKKQNKKKLRHVFSTIESNNQIKNKIT